MHKTLRLIALTAALALCVTGLSLAGPETRQDVLEVTYYYLPG